MKVYISRNKQLQKVIMTFFTKTGGLFECDSCKKLLRGYSFILKEHLKVNHESPWESYLCKLGRHMKKALGEFVEPSERRFLKCKVDCVLPDGRSVSLTLPESRVTRETFSLDQFSVLEKLDGFKGRMQKEFNEDNYGPYMGPYDQSDKLPLKLQLPGSELTFQTYTDFRHEDPECHSYSIKKSYSEIGDLEKIKSLQIEDAADDRIPIKVKYTCQSKKCEIPCICKDCCLGDPQCKAHNVAHEDTFDYERDSMTIRSSKDLFKDSSFLSHCYTIRYPKIPINCPECEKDLLHHNLYHIKYHESCKFCLQLRHKLTASTPQDFQKEVKFQAKFLGCICPHCGKQFVERHKRDKHLEYAHGKTRICCAFCEKRFATEGDLKQHESVAHPKAEHYKKAMHLECPQCDQKFFDKLSRKKHIEKAHGNKRNDCNLCEETFASKQALIYHLDIFHKNTSPVKCDMCFVTFTSLVSLKNHKKYLHSSPPKSKCCLCDAKFKQKKELNFHIRNRHQVNTYDHFMNDWNDPEDRQIFQCNLCENDYKYKKDLEAHNKKCHGKEVNTFTCSKCDKCFSQKNNCLRHERNHK